MHLQNNVLWQTRDALRIKEEGCLFLGLRVMEPSARAQSLSIKALFMKQNMRFGLFRAVSGSITPNPRKRLPVEDSFYETKFEILASLDQLGSSRILISI